MNDTLNVDPQITKSETSNLSTIVTLNPSQYFLYQTYQLEIKAPGGRHLGF